MKIVVVGTRGIPEIQGGVETHCQELYPRLAAKGHDVTVICRSSYLKEGHSEEYKGVKLMSVYAPRKKSFEAIVHTTLAILKAKRLKPDILHIHAIGPSLMTPLAKILGMKVVMTHHGPDYERQKWGRMAKAVLRGGERQAARYADRIVSISAGISRLLKEKYGREKGVALIPNGVVIPRPSASDDYIRSLGLEPGKYVVALGRFVPEKGFHNLIEAWERTSHEGWKLAIAGDADHPDDYSRRLKEMAAATADVVMTGFIKGEPLKQLMSHGSVFAMPSYHEGLPIALLEAMSYGLDVITSDIEACRLEELNSDDVFPTGNIEALSEILGRKISKAEKREYDLSRYDWDKIAEKTEDVYSRLLNNKGGVS